MFSSRKLFAAILAFALALSPVAAQIPVTGAGGSSGDSSSVTPVSNACLTSGGTTITFTAQGTGTANANRISVVSINWSDSTNASTASVTGVTLGGASMARVAINVVGATNSNSEIWALFNPTGTSDNIVVTAATAINGMTIEVYSLVGYNSGVPVATTTGTTSASQAYTNKQVAIAAGSRQTNVSTSLSNMVNDFSSACGTGLWGVHASQVLHGTGTLSTSISPTGNTPLITMAVWSQTAPAGCAEATAFLARTSGLGSVYSAAYTTLICGLVTDGIWAKLDGLYIFATKNTTTALLNLVSSSFNGIANGSPTFTANQGYTGVQSSTTVYIDTQFNPATATTPKFVLNSGHISCWNLTNGTDNGYCAGVDDTIPGSTQSYIRVRDASLARVNFAINGPVILVTNGNPVNFYVSNRTVNTTVEGYIGGGNTPFLSGASTSTVVANRNLTAISLDNSGVRIGTGFLTAQVGWGSGLAGSDVTLYYNRLHLWMQTFAGQP